MARYLTAPQANPSILGEDVAGLAWEGVGLALTAVGNDKIVGPVTRQLVPGITANPTGAKVADAVSTGITAYLASMAVGMVDHTIGRRIKRGGAVLVIGKLLSIVVPGFSISASVPVPFNLPSFNAPAQLAKGDPKVVALPVRPAASGLNAI